MTGVQHDPDRALRAGYSALIEAAGRHATDCNQNRPDAAYGSLVEAAFWIATLDSLVSSDDGPRNQQKTAYRSARAADRDGQVVFGILWARNRLYHQMPFAISHDGRSFFDPPEDGDGTGILYISAGTLWLPATDLDARSRPRGDAPGSRKAYEDEVANRPTNYTLDCAIRWFATTAAAGFLPSLTSP